MWKVFISVSTSERSSTFFFSPEIKKKKTASQFCVLKKRVLKKRSVSLILTLFGDLGTLPGRAGPTCSNGTVRDRLPGVFLACVRHEELIRVGQEMKETRQKGARDPTDS